MAKPDRKPRRGQNRTVFDHTDIAECDDYRPRKRRRKYEEDESSLFDDALYDVWN